MTDRYRLERYPTNPQLPAAIFDFGTPDGRWYRLVASFAAGKATMKEAEIMCAALNRDMGKEQNPEDGPPARSPAGVPPTQAPASPPAEAAPAGERKPEDYLNA